MTFHGKVNLQDGRVTASAKFVMPYVSWGRRDPITFVLRVDDKVDLELSLTELFTEGRFEHGRGTKRDKGTKKETGQMAIR